MYQQCIGVVAVPYLALLFDVCMLGLPAVLALLWGLAGVANLPGKRAADAAWFLDVTPLGACSAIMPCCNVPGSGHRAPVALKQWGPLPK